MFHTRLKKTSCNGCKTTLPNKNAFYSELYLQDNTDIDYIHAQKVFKGFGLKNLGDYHDLYARSDTLSLGDVFENFRNKYIEIYKPDPAHFLSASGLAWQDCLKKTGVKLKLLTNIDMLWLKKELGAEICHAIHSYAKANNEYMKNYNNGTESLHTMYLDAHNLYGCGMSQKLPVNGVKWKKNVPKFDEGFMKKYDENSDKGYILEEDVEYPKDLLNLHSDLPFFPERKFKNVISLFVI